MPEVWIQLAELTGIDELRRTTRDEPDYDVLMTYRLGILTEHDLTMSTVAEVLAEIKPLDGAPDFLDELRSRHQVLLLSDTSPNCVLGQVSRCDIDMGGKSLQPGPGQLAFEFDSLMARETDKNVTVVVLRKNGNSKEVSVDVKTTLLRHHDSVMVQFRGNAGHV